MTKKFLGQLFRVAALVGGLAAAALIVLYSAFYGKAIENEKVIYISLIIKGFAIECGV